VLRSKAALPQSDYHGDMAPPTAWLLTEDKAGMRVQALALAEALGLDYAELTPLVPPLWARLPTHLWPRAAASRWIAPEGPRAFAPPWPDLVISCGRRSVPFALGVRWASEGAVRAVHIQDPRVALDRFDVVVAPAHDELEGANVVTTRGSMTRITPARLEAAAAQFASSLAHLPRPLVAVLLGGSNKVYQFTEERAETLARLLRRVAAAGAGLAITASRRTDARALAVLRAGIADLPATLWAGEEDNPYFGYLGLADAVVVTADSVNMVCEACTTGRPVHVFPLEGRGSAKFRSFHREMRALGYTRPFEGRLEHWHYAPLADAARAAAAIRNRLGLVFGGP
jgi:uncharacterized protein